MYREHHEHGDVVWGAGGRHSVIRSLSRDYRKGNGELIKSFDYERAFMLY